MTHERRDLEKLVAPPQNQFGTHMLLCGLSADTETLERLIATFTSENPVERAANGLVRSILMLDASAPRLDPLAVPGMLQLEHCQVEQWAEQTSLMHAKVALLGFADAKFAAPTSFRLLVSTGNWTRETWGSGSQIDMFWSTEWSTSQDPALSDDHADMAAALAFFDRLMQALYPQSTAALARQPLAAGWLGDWKRLLGQDEGYGKPRFIHSLDKALLPQIGEAFPDKGSSVLVVGSGFWEQPAEGTCDKPEVLVQLDKLEVRAERYLVANIGQAGALAPWLAANPKAWASGKIGGWTLCTPRDPLPIRPGSGRSFLHAKYIAGMSRKTQDGDGTLNFLYLGSGNLSRAGVLSTARLGKQGTARQRAGNVEAGVVLAVRQDIKDVWRALACGDYFSPEEIQAMIPGTGEEILVPRTPSPVVLARVENGRLILVRSTVEPMALEIRIDAVGAWIVVGASDDGLPLDDGLPPSVIWVRLPVGTGVGAEVYEVAVLAEDGTCCRQAPNEVGIGEVLDALLAFPAAPPHLPDPEPSLPTGRAAAASTLAKRYPLKLLAQLIEAIGHRNSVLKREQFGVWLSQLRYLLLEQVSAADREAIREAGVNLFPALFQPGFMPAWLEQDAELNAAYRNLVRDIEKSWTVPAAETCPVPSGRRAEKGEPVEEQT